MTEEKRINESTKILLWVYGVGLTGMLLPFTRELFIKITPLNLLFAAAFLFYGEKPAPRVIITGSVIAIVSFLIEAYAVNTGKIFGTYTYGKALGPALLNTPLIIGLNWFLLIYCTNLISRQIWSLMPEREPGRLTSVTRFLFIVVSGSMLMVLYDMILEPAAMRLEMWSWEGDRVPARNYLAWFLFSAVFHSVVRLWGEEEINRRALPLFAVQLIFFAVLDLYYLLAP